MATVQEIYNEIDRIENSKSGIAGAIEEKGVEVPPGAKIDEYPGLVRQIQQGANLVSFDSDTNLVVVPGKQNERKTVNLLISYAYDDGIDTSYHLSILSFATSALDNPAPVRQILRNDLTEIGSWLVGKITATGEIFVYPTDLNSGDIKVYVYDMDGIQLELRSDEDEGYPTNDDFNDAVLSVDDKICDSVKFSSQTLTASQKLQARTNIGATTQEVFHAVCGTTLYADVLAAYNAGMFVVCYYSTTKITYFLTRYNNDTFTFLGSTGTGGIFSATLNSGGWEYASVAPEESANKVSTISGNETNTTKYPNTKAVADYVSGIVGNIETLLAAI